MEPVTLKVDEVVLRPFRPSDADAVYRACQDPLIPRWTGVPQPYLPADADRYVGEFVPHAWREDSGAPFGAFDSSSGELLGACGLVALDRAAGTAEIGYWTAPWARGRAVATRAAREVCRWAFSELQLRQIRWRAEVGNHASRLVALRIGVRIDGVNRGELVGRDGRLSDAWVGALRPDELTTSDPQAYAPDSMAARQAAVFSAAQPRLAGTTDSGRPVALRAPTAADVDGLYTKWQDAEVQRWTSVPVPYRREHAEGFIVHASETWRHGDGIISAVVDAQDELVGLMDLRLKPSLKHDPGLADVGFAMSAAARGHGYTTAALRRVCQFGFTELGLHRIVWQAYVGNDASRRVAVKAGFTMEGTLRAAAWYRGERLDAWIGSRLVTDPAPLEQAVLA